MRKALLASVVAVLFGTYVHADAQSVGVEAPSGTAPNELGLTELTDDFSRQKLFKEVIAANLADNPPSRRDTTSYDNLYGPFRFPNDAIFDVSLKRPRTNVLFGIDISHWTGRAFPVEQLNANNVLFVYMKASQGNGVDGSFAQFWARSGKLHRGAYHFLTCGDPATPAESWGTVQADAFIKVIKASGGLRVTDLPPTLDLEWDKTQTEHDRWSCRKPAEIIAMVKVFQERIKAVLGRTPLVYTARAWWRERMGAEVAFARLSTYPLWLADYSKSARASEIPPQINGTPWTLWQFTNAATLAIDYNRRFDASIFKGSKAEFLSTFGVADLP